MAGPLSGRGPSSSSVSWALTTGLRAPSHSPVRYPLLEGRADPLRGRVSHRCHHFHSADGKTDSNQGGWRGCTWNPDLSDTGTSVFPLPTLSGIRDLNPGGRHVGTHLGLSLDSFLTPRMLLIGATARSKSVHQPTVGNSALLRASGRSSRKWGCSPWPHRTSGCWVGPKR